jgi:hypothetical protein
MLGHRWRLLVAVTTVAAMTALGAAAASAATPRLWVASGPALYEFEAGATGNTAPIAVISGPSTQLGNPTSLAIDPAGNIWVSDLMGGAKVLEFKVGSTDDVAPIQTLAGSRTHITETYGIWFDRLGHLFLGNVGTAPDPDRELEFAAGAHGNVAPIANIVGNKTGIDAPGDVTTDAARRHVDRRLRRQRASGARLRRHRECGAAGDDQGHRHRARNPIRDRDRPLR